jgi:hypothetical protein
VAETQAQQILRRESDLFARRESRTRVGSDLKQGAVRCVDGKKLDVNANPDLTK